MKPANDPTVDYKDLVRSGYDRCAGAYAASRRRDDTDLLVSLQSLLPDGSDVLDLGCGAGVPITRALSERHSVTGVDISCEMLRLARGTVPEGRFIHSDILSAEFEENSFDAAVCMYVLFHLPQEEHSDVFSRVWSWLRPGGYFLVTLTEFAEAAYTEDDFFGVPMYWSNLGWGEYEMLLLESGFAILGGKIIGHGYGATRDERDERHPLVLAQKRDRPTDS